MTEEEDLYLLIANARGISRKEAKELVFRVAYRGVDRIYSDFNALKKAADQAEAVFSQLHSSIERFKGNL